MPLDDEWDPLTAPTVSVVGYSAKAVAGSIGAGVAFGGRAYLDIHLGAALSFGAAVGYAHWTAANDEIDGGYDGSSVVSASPMITLRISASEGIRQYLRALGGLSFAASSGPLPGGRQWTREAGWHAGGVYGLYVGWSRVGLLLELGVIVHQLRAESGTEGHEAVTHHLMEVPVALGLQIGI